MAGGARSEAVSTPDDSTGAAYGASVVMSHPFPRPDEVPHGVAFLANDLTDEQLAAAPVLRSIETLVIEGPSAKEDDVFAAAVDIDQENGPAWPGDSPLGR